MSYKCQEFQKEGVASAKDCNLAISAKGLTKKYYGKRKSLEKLALRAIDLDIPTGAFFGLLGPNGAGKSSFINILAGTSKKTSGRVHVMGYDIDSQSRKSRSALGVVPQELHIDSHFTPYETLEFQAGFYGVPKAHRQSDKILKTLGLAEQRNWYARRLSGGMRRRLLVGKALVHRPPVLILDEPTAGVDVEVRHLLWNYVQEINELGTTIVLTTHYLEEAERLCDRIAIINHGEVVACDKTPFLMRRMDEKKLTITLADDLECIPKGLVPFEAVIEGKRKLHLRYHRGQYHMGEILSAIHTAKLQVKDLSTQESKLEDLFLQLTGRLEAVKEKNKVG